MSPCLVQQLFRQKIGQELDANLFEAHIFPYLRKQKSSPRLLLQDIKLARGSSDYVDKTGWHKEKSVIVQIVHDEDEDQEPDWPDVVNISPFSRSPQTMRLLSELSGKCSSLYRRDQVPPHLWGSIDILNQLRELMSSVAKKF